VGDGCSAGSDCASTFCSAWTVDEPPICVVSHCESGVKDGDEGGVDCGGSTCPKCATGAEADGAADCESGAHNGAICVASTCFDMALSSGETAVDCGGSTCAQRCGFQQACKQNGDCAQGLACHPTQNVCLRDLEQACTAGADCVTDNCQSGVCAAIDTTCSNGAQDGAETDVDCGGPACDKCGVLEHCMLNSDCVFDHCVLLSGSSGGHCMAPSNLISAWPFDGSGKDVSGNGNSALLMGNSSYTTQAHSGGQAASFAATSSWAVTSSIDVGNELTLTGWLYLPSPGPGGSMPIITSAQSFSTPNGFDFMVNPPQSTLALGFDSGDGSTGCTVTSADNVLALDTWQHVAVAVNRTAGTAILYVNGAAVAGTGCVSTAFPTNQSLVLGGWVNYDGPGTGQLDDVRIYGSVLTATEIAAIAQQ
jgi:hypothetical protein